MRITTANLWFVACLVLALALVGCGGGSSGNSSPNVPPSGTQITVTFGGGVNPLAVAEQIGTGSWSTVTAPTNGQLTITLPNGTNNYALAYMCPSWQGMSPVSPAFVIEATVSDATAYTVSCFTNPTTGAATGSVDATAIAGTAKVQIVGAQGYSTLVNAASGPFSATLPTGTNDIAAIALDGSNNILAVKIVRGQSVPGAVNNGGTISLAAGDAVSAQTLAVSNIPSGFNTTPAVSAEYYTANGTLFQTISSSQTQYAVIPSADAQSGDYYYFSANTANGNNQHIYALQLAPTASAVSLSMPAALSYVPPSPAAFPSFNISYPGVSGATASGASVSIQWFTSSNVLDDITVYASSASLNGASTLAVPDLTSLSGFLPSAASGTTVYWFAYVYGGTYPWFTVPPSSGAMAFGQNTGTYTQP